MSRTSLVLRLFALAVVAAAAAVVALHVTDAAYPRRTGTVGKTVSVDQLLGAQMTQLLPPTGRSGPIESTQVSAQSQATVEPAGVVYGNGCA